MSSEEKKVISEKVKVFIRQRPVAISLVDDNLALNDSDDSGDIDNFQSGKKGTVTSIGHITLNPNGTCIYSSQAVSTNKPSQADEKKTFQFEECFDQQSTQQDIFLKVRSPEE